MRKVKKILTLVLIIVCMGFLYESATAGKQNYICYIDQVGCQGTGTRVMLTHEGGAFNQKWFLCKSKSAREMLAILLTAINGDLQVKVYTDPNQQGVPEIKRLYVIAP